VQHGLCLFRVCPKTGVLAPLSAAFVESFVELGQKTRIPTKAATKVADKVQFWDRSNQSLSQNSTLSATFVAALVEIIFFWPNSTKDSTKAADKGAKTPVLGQTLTYPCV
jgi:hypothetical protein